MEKSTYTNAAIAEHLGNSKFYQIFTQWDFLYKTSFSYGRIGGEWLEKHRENF